MKIAVTILILLMWVAAGANDLKCKIDPSITPETNVTVFPHPSMTYIGTTGGVMGELTMLGGDELEIYVLEGNKTIAKTVGSASLTQTAEAVTSNGSEVKITCSP